MTDTYLKRSLDSANDKAKYDENVKTILSDKTILSWILTTLLSSRMTPKGKEEVLEHTYGIPMSYELKEATGRMCNLSDLVEERGIEKGIEKGIEQGTELKLISLVLKKLKKSCTVSQIADALEEPEEKISQIMKIAQKYAPEYDERKILAELMESSGN